MALMHRCYFSFYINGSSLYYIILLNKDVRQTMTRNASLFN